MKPAGKMINISKKGNIILRSRKAPDIGLFIVDRRSTPVGKVIRVTGPVSDPYVILRPAKSDPTFFNSLLGKDLFISEKPIHDNKKRGSNKRFQKPGQDRKRWNDSGKKPEKKVKSDNEPGKKREYGRRIPRKDHNKGKGRSR